MASPAASPAPVAPGGRKAWAALVTRPTYLPGLLALHRTLVSVSSYPLVVLATDALPESARAIVRKRGLEVIDIEHLAPAEGTHSGFGDKHHRFHDTWTKLQVFGLDQFERLILIDADTIFLRGMDELFDIELGKDWIAAAPVCACNPFKFAHYPEDWVPANCALSHQPRPTTIDNVPQPALDGPRTSHLLNSGVVVLHPSRELMDTLLNHLDTSPTIAEAQFPDQDVLAEVFKGKWRVLPWWTNSLKTERAVHQNIWDDGEVRLLHFILEKPWVKRPAGLPVRSVLPTPPRSPAEGVRRPLPAALLEAVHSAPPQPSKTDYDILHSWWWAVYDDLLAELQTEAGSGWEEIDRYVAH
ncbi:hypothetical protein Q8F55_003554 [Vanrija albida]|uniref:Galactinol synthase n=1 Tax=Vanrija albida TaxID=181172 RepID=A0ABR3Q4B3_9TREE